MMSANLATSAKLARFTFDLDMSSRANGAAHNGSRAPQPASVAPDVIARMVADARNEGFIAGRSEGERNASAQAAQTLAAAAGALATSSAEMAAALDDARKAVLRDGVELAASIGRKLALNLLAREPARELEALIEECMASLEGVPHLVIRCHPDLADALREIATARMATSGFAGRLIVMGDPEQTLGDGRIEWVDGGLVRNIVAISAEIDARIAAYLAVHHALPSDQTNHAEERHS